ncbi:bifunctional DNA primase/polymerase [Streptomonospora salina]|uniref:DNA primase/polymerase bifunctional N-terminal domain-containing protein n=1 Tax=Streptomonospora salina TaxID=104205 RepID=A0A841EIR6_9ACTN|nr:bifunctional DNA primase/polymerase [Streptomonospora salina]MBB6000250.1 hypothetical protein [Streptomonospora salina]
MVTPQQQWADALVRAGYHLFPCQPNSKIPACTGGVTAAINDPEGIADHWAAHPDHNIGISCGASHLVVVDCDRPKSDDWRWPSDWASVAGEYWDGTDAYCYLIEQAGHELSRGDFDLLGTMVVMTPSGGMHFYFQAAPNFAIRNSAGVLAPLIDIRAEGGYVLGPGSTVGGRPYDYLIDAPPAAMPGWLGYALQGVNQRRRSQDTRPPGATHYRGAPPNATYAERALEDMALAPDGERHDTFVSRIFRLALDESKGTVDLTALEPRIRDIGRSQGRTEREITQAIASGRAKAVAGSP